MSVAGAGETTGQALCRDCGLCCSGVMFGYVPLTAADGDRMRGQRLPVVTENGGLALMLPCSAHDGDCRIYESRPEMCAKYSCGVLQAVERGELAEQDARARLTAILALVATIRPKLPNDTSLWRAAKRMFGGSREVWRANAELLLDLAQLRALLAPLRPGLGPWGSDLVD